MTNCSDCRVYPSGVTSATKLPSLVLSLRTRFRQEITNMDNFGCICIYLKRQYAFISFTFLDYKQVEYLSMIREKYICMV